jgi:hypothetical protein
MYASQYLIRLHANGEPDVLSPTLSVALSFMSNGHCEIQAHGGPCRVSEFAEQIAWLAATLRILPLQKALMVQSPRISILSMETSTSQDPKVITISSELTYEIQDN